jgi:hypothetical protein
VPAVSAPSAELRKDAVSLEISFFMQTQQPNDDRQQNPEKNVEQKHVDGKNNVVLGAGRDITGDIHIGHLGDNYGPQPLQIEYSIEQTRVLPIHPDGRKMFLLDRVPRILGIAGERGECAWHSRFFRSVGEGFYDHPDTPCLALAHSRGIRDYGLGDLS